MNFKSTSPCKDCPYRKDAPLAKWNVLHFIDVIRQDRVALGFGKVFGCHKKDDSICRGYLMNQADRDYPSNTLRMMLIQEQVPRTYLDKLHCKSERFETIEEMAEANFPKLKDKLN